MCDGNLIEQTQHKSNQWRGENHRFSSHVGDGNEAMGGMGRCITLQSLLPRSMPTQTSTCCDCVNTKRKFKSSNETENILCSNNVGSFILTIVHFDDTL
jgi:hypothetical protein